MHRDVILGGVQQELYGVLTLLGHLNKLGEGYNIDGYLLEQRWQQVAR
jgi:hypothetical protein